MGEYGVLGDYSFMFTAKAKSGLVKLVSIPKDTIQAMIYMNPDLRILAEKEGKPLRVHTDLFLDFRIVRNESRKMKNKKILKLAIIRYSKLINAIGFGFSFKHFSFTEKKRASEPKISINAMLQSVFTKLNELSEENKEIKFTMEDTTSKLNAFEQYLNKIEKEQSSEKSFDLN